MKKNHDLSIVEEKYRHIVSVLLEWQDSLSDGYGWYCEFATLKQDHDKYQGDKVVAALVEIAKEILGEGDNDGS